MNKNIKHWLAAFICFIVAVISLIYPIKEYRGNRLTSEKIANSPLGSNSMETMLLLKEWSASSDAEKSDFAKSVMRYRSALLEKDLNALESLLVPEQVKIASESNSIYSLDDIYLIIPNREQYIKSSLLGRYSVIHATNKPNSRFAALFQSRQTWRYENGWKVKDTLFQD